MAAPFKRDKLYYFRYDPKGKEVLPFWDRRPFAFPLRISTSHSLMINVHWVPYRFRRRFIEMLLEMSKKIQNPKRFSRLTYNIIKSDPRLRPALRGIRLYINSRASGVTVITKEEATDPIMPRIMNKSLFRKHPARKVFYTQRRK